MTPVRLEPATLGLESTWHSTNKPLRFLSTPMTIKRCANTVDPEDARQNATVQLCLLGNFALLIFFFKISFFKNLFQEYYQRVKQFGSRPGPIFCQAWSGSKLFAKVISRRHNLSSTYILAF